MHCTASILGGSAPRTGARSAFELGSVKLANPIACRFVRDAGFVHMPQYKLGHRAEVCPLSFRHTQKECLVEMRTWEMDFLKATVEDVVELVPAPQYAPVSHANKRTASLSGIPYKTHPRLCATFSSTIHRCQTPAGQSQGRRLLPLLSSRPSC